MKKGKVSVSPSVPCFIIAFSKKKKEKKEQSKSTFLYSGVDGERLLCSIQWSSINLYTPIDRTVHRHVVDDVREQSSSTVVTSQ